MSTPARPSPKTRKQKNGTAAGEGFIWKNCLFHVAVEMDPGTGGGAPHTCIARDGSSGGACGIFGGGAIDFSGGGVTFGNYTTTVGNQIGGPLSGGCAHLASNHPRLNLPQERPGRYGRGVSSCVGTKGHGC